GGETAEMPGFYEAGEYDLAGFSVGIVRKDKIINGSKIEEGDALVGLGSSGVHSNGFSLVRKLYPMDGSLKTAQAGGGSLGELLLAPTKIYVKPVLALIESVEVRGIAHITGGGFYENIPRTLPKGMGARIHLGSWEMPKVFEKIMEDAQLSERDAFGTFNMGVGMVVVVPREQAEKAVELLRGSGEKASVIGKVVAGEGVKLWE
ncbi:MAG TPA: phosphoribosylformylglycinamidine cyclo-ligase, partial [Clostridiales bacterium]|nr:phosphoribosylformylglycinamidine cyclo-ligase [Clostridiales bacterium]